jgi:hypothetical protein
VRRRSFEAELLARKDVVRAELQRATRGAFGAVSGWDERLVMTFAEQVRGRSDSFLRTFRSMLDSLADAGTPPAAIASVISVLREQMMTCLGHDLDLSERVDELIRKAQVAASSYVPSSGRMRVPR